METRGIDSTTRGELKPDEQKAQVYFTRIEPATDYAYFKSNNKVQELEEIKTLRPISVISIINAEPDRFTYLQSCITQLFQEVLEVISLTFSFDKLNFALFKKAIIPFLLASACYLGGDWVFNNISQFALQAPNFGYLIKVGISLGILERSSLFSITNYQPTEFNEFTYLAAQELLAIAYWYSSIYEGCHDQLSKVMTESSAFLGSLLASTVIFPTALVYILDKRYHNQLQKLYQQGAQRSDTAYVSNGKTLVSNIFFQIYFLLKRELSFIRSFQIGLIANNVFESTILTKQLRNLPSMLVDILPNIMRKLMNELAKIQYDFNKNTSKVFILDPKFNLTLLKEVSLHSLRTGDLVWCGKNINFNAIPISGEIHAFNRDHKGDFLIDSALDYDIQVNLKTYTGENIWIKNPTNKFQKNVYREIAQRAIQDHQLTGILVGGELDLNGKQENCFIRVGVKKEVTNSHFYEKKAVINDIINHYKQKNIKLAVLASLLSGLYFGLSPIKYGLNSLRLLFSVYQMIIPLSEVFLREMVNSKIMHDINYLIPEAPLDLLDGLRLTDFWFAMNGYYEDLFPRGAVIISDKTGTLTTMSMEAKGLWSTEMKIIPESNISLLSNHPQLTAYFTLFTAAFTCSKEEFEPEEHAILNMFKNILNAPNCLQFEEILPQHYKKTLCLDTVIQFETIHLGLFTKLGGRFTLLQQNHKSFLIFCGIPKGEAFNETNLYKAYHSMQSRSGVLSRDWGLAQQEISRELFNKIAHLHELNKKDEIDILLNYALLKQMKHICTFLVDNPVKANVENFIASSRHARLPFIVATGDTTRAAQNIVQVLFPNINQSIHEQKNKAYIFTGITKENLNQLSDLLKSSLAPPIIFAEMTTQDKGQLANFLKEQGYFVVANGDGSNDIEMMRVANFVIGHQMKDGEFAPGISNFVNISDNQVQKLSGTTKPFYTLFDIGRKENCEFILPFVRLANSQEMVSHVLNFKAIKVGYELAKVFINDDVEEMWHQNLLSMAFDLAWLGIGYISVLNNNDLPVDKKHLGRSTLALKCLIGTFLLASLESFLAYEFSGKSGHIWLMVAQLALAPLVLNSFFKGFEETQKMQSYCPPSASLTHQVNKPFFGLFKNKSQPNKDIPMRVDVKLRH